VLITLELVEDLDDDNTEKIVIQRNFLDRKKKILKINDRDI
jgi:hypothetical protein